MNYFDAHAHPQFPPFDADRDALLTRMKEKGVSALVVGVDKKSSRAATELAGDHEGLWASVGLHPNDTPEEEFDEHEFRNLLMFPKVVAIGECGLDYFRPADTDTSAKARQKGIFEKHIRLAGETGRPLVIHARPSKGSMDAYEDALDMLESAKKEFGDKLKGDFHFFVGDVETARRIFSLDFTVSYTAVVTFARDYDEAIRFAPLDRILTETDSPYVAPASRRGQRNDSLSVIDIVRALAGIRNEDEETLRTAVLENARRLFRLENA